MTLQSIEDYVHRIMITPHERTQPHGTRHKSWECSIDLRFDPPHHTVTGTGPTMEDAIRRAVQRARVHIAMAQAGS